MAAVIENCTYLMLLVWLPPVLFAASPHQIQFANQWQSGTTVPDSFGDPQPQSDPHRLAEDPLHRQQQSNGVEPADAGRRAAATAAAAADQEGGNYTVSNVSVQLGTTAYLHCHVRHSDRATSGSEQISWVRRRDWHILSSGMFVFTNDERFQVVHAEGSDDWTLQIKYVQKRDNGTYECQLATGLGIVSLFVQLQIIVPEAFILGSSERHVDRGSIIRLVCVIEKGRGPPQYVLWHHNDRMINFDAVHRGVTIETDPGPQTQSRLTIRDARDSDSGNYTCSAANTEPALIHVFVSQGDNMAATLRRKASSASRRIATHVLSVLLIGHLIAVPLSSHL